MYVPKALGLLSRRFFSIGSTDSVPSSFSVRNENKPFSIRSTCWLLHFLRLENGQHLHKYLISSEPLQLSKNKYEKINTSPGGVVVLNDRKLVLLRPKSPKHLKLAQIYRERMVKYYTTKWL